MPTIAPGTSDGRTEHSSRPITRATVEPRTSATNGPGDPPDEAAARKAQVTVAPASNTPTTCNPAAEVSPGDAAREKTGRRRPEPIRTQPAKENDQRLKGAPVFSVLVMVGHTRGRR